MAQNTWRRQKTCVGQFRRFLLQATKITNAKKTILLWYETYYRAKLVLKTATDTMQHCISCSVDFNAQTFSCVG